MNDSLKIAGFQIGPLEEKGMIELLGKLDFSDCDIVVFPERFIMDTYDNFQKSDAYPILSEISRGKILIAGSVLEKDNHQIYNRSYVFYDGFPLGFQDKIVPYDREKGRIGMGRIINIFRTPKLTFSVPVCYDMDFPFFAKISTVKGATLLLNPSLIRKDFHKEWHTYIEARALENRIAAISVNSGNENFAGDSVFFHTYVEDGGVRTLKVEAGDLQRFNCVFTNNGVEEKRKMRIREDPAYYSFPSKEIVYE